MLKKVFENKFRWIIVILILLITIVTYIDRMAIAYAITPLEEEFHLNNEAFGWILGGFGFGYIVMTIVGGLLCDKFGVRWVWSSAVVSWSVVMMCMSQGKGFWSFFILRVLLGLAEGIHFPALVRTIANWLPKEDSAKAISFGILGVPLASVIGSPLCSWLIAAFNWKVMFVILGALGLLWVIFWLYLFRDHPSESKRVSAQEKELLASLSFKDEALISKMSFLKQLVKNKSLLINNWTFFVFGYLIFFGISWLPGYFEQVHHLKIREVGVFLILPWALGCITILAGGLLSDRIFQKSQNLRKARSHLIWISQLLSAISFLFLIFPQNLTSSIILISLGIALGLFPNSIFFNLNIDLARQHTGFSTGIMNAFFAFAGIISPILTGILTERFGNFSGAFILLFCITLSSVALVLFFQRPDKDIVK